MNEQKSGQAMLELICGLVGVVVVIAMLLQVNLISRERMLMVLDTRIELAEELSSYGGRFASANFLSDWEAGRDGYDYSEDDVATRGDASSFLVSISDAVRIDDLERHIGDTNKFSDVCSSYSSSLVGAFDVMEVEGETEPIEILPGVRRLVFNADEIIMTHQIYMPWMNNIME